MSSATNTKISCLTFIRDYSEINANVTHLRKTQTLTEAYLCFADICCVILLQSPGEVLRETLQSSPQKLLQGKARPRPLENSKSKSL